MKKIIVNGSKKLYGEIDVQGSKNSALPILAACVLVNGVSVIHNCPDLTDVSAAIKILEHLGCKVEKNGNIVTVDSRKITCYNIPQGLMREMRSSIVFLGSVLSRMKKVRLSAPGGCEIGLRPIDLHLSAIRSLGVKTDESHGDIYCEADSGIKPGVISLSFPSVGATENIILASVFAKGRTIVLNAAMEPEISDLAAFLNKCGCMVSVEGDGTVIIDGVKEAHGAEHTVLPDRIVALTYMCAVGAAGGEIVLKNACPSSFMSVIPVFESAGCTVSVNENDVYVKSQGRLKRVKDIRTMPYPGFPTDAQAPVMAMLCTAKGTSVIVENIFESRFKHVPELLRMGARIRIEGRVAIIDGTTKLHGAKVSATDLRGGGAMLVAALAAQGRTEIDSVEHIDRGYENITAFLKAVGADVERRD